MLAPVARLAATRPQPGRGAPGSAAAPQLQKHINSKGAQKRPNAGWKNTKDLHVVPGPLRLYGTKASPGHKLARSQTQTYETRALGAAEDSRYQVQVRPPDPCRGRAGQKAGAEPPP